MENPFCTNAWHDELEPDSIHCPSCGERVDGKITLANLPFGMSGGGQVHSYRHIHSNEKITGHVTEIGPDGVSLALQLEGGGAKVIPGHELHDWLLDEGDDET